MFFRNSSKRAVFLLCALLALSGCDGLDAETAHDETEHNKTILREPNDAKAHTHRGTSLAYRGELDEAVAAFSEAIRNDR